MRQQKFSPIHVHTAICIALMLGCQSLAAMPGPHLAVDGNTQALWHFDEPDDSPVSFADASGNSHSLIRYGNSVLRTLDGAPGFGRSLTGFSVTSGVEVTTLPDHPSQTFESWIMWPDAASLPQAWQYSQVIVAKLVSNSFSIRLAVDGGSQPMLTVEIHQRLTSTTWLEESLSAAVAPEPNTWYHAAYTLEMGDFDGHADTVDTRLRLYWNDEDNTDTTPDPIAEQVFEDFEYRADGWRFRIGKRYGSGNDQFRGRIDEVRYSDKVRTRFDTFMLGDLGQYRGKGSFVMLDGIFGNFVGKPDLTTLGFRSIRLLGGAWPGHFWPPGADVALDFPDQATTRARARSFDQDSGKLYYIDIEHLPLSYQDGQEEVAASIQKLAAIADWIHAERPAIRLGYYSLMPQRSYWHAVSGNTATWQAHNTFLQRLGRHVDVVFPSVYTFYGDRPGWVRYATENLEEARKYSKPVYAFIWPVYHSGGDQSLAGTLVEGDFWRLQLETLYDLADGIVIWASAGGAYPTWESFADDTDVDSWWYQTLDFMADKGLVPP